MHGYDEAAEQLGEAVLAYARDRLRPTPVAGWAPADYQQWSDRLLTSGFAFAVPTVHRGETVARFAIVNPRTTEADIAAILGTMA